MIHTRTMTANDDDECWVRVRWCEGVITLQSSHQTKWATHKFSHANMREAKSIATAAAAAAISKRDRKEGGLSKMSSLLEAAGKP